MIRIQQIRLNVTEDEKSIRNKAAKKLHILPDDIEKLSIVKKSIDARKKPELFFSYVVDITCKNEDKIILSCTSIMDHYIAFVRIERGSPFLWFSKMDGFEQLD